MSNVLDQAQNVQGIVKAARLRDSWARKEANATDEGQRRLYREAIFDLEQRFGDLGDVPVGGAEAFARERGHGRGSRSPVHEGRRRTRPGPGGSRTSSKKSAAKGSKRRAWTPRRRPRAGSTPRPTPKVDRAIAQTGIPAAVDSGGSTLMWALGMTVSAGLGYLLLTSAEKGGSGTTRLEHLLRDVVPKGIGNFLNPYKDVLSETGVPSSPEEGHTGIQQTGHYHGRVDTRTPGFHPFHHPAQGGSRR